MNSGSKFYAKLLRLYPTAYRERFEEEMFQVFDDMYAERTPQVRFWLKVLSDTLATAFTENLKVDEYSSTLFMKRFPLWLYVVAVILVLAIVNYTSWLKGGASKLHNVEYLSAGFLLGMLAMYIAVHVYRWKGDGSQKGDRRRGK